MAAAPLTASLLLHFSTARSGLGLCCFAFCSMNRKQNSKVFGNVRRLPVTFMVSCYITYKFSYERLLPGCDIQPYCPTKEKVSGSSAVNLRRNGSDPHG
eukprot:920217-Rhodomonas_salina.2